MNFNKKQQQCFDSLCKLAESLGVQVLFIEESDIGGWNSEVLGEKEIAINIKPKNRYSSLEHHVLVTFAHELRHSIHYRRGLYPMYYLYEDMNDIEKTEDKIEFLIQGYYAELDCESWSRNYVHNYGMKDDFKFIYDANFFVYYYIRWYQLHIYFKFFMKFWFDK